ncbi:hypothetical protein Val02_64510 [Virgisporangium aliadipatigenens]|uniref:Fibronectin type-III domain-containing protein n=1 Tax=Virgisporangium aliadipatigenens TaxID=741659 RepID=A0A8J3YTF6_9ACTN|nr:ricin-type beta-trefoil lectin domain protein [Virgisporangium aliadipatigenens]GIJ49565.1 hypothetical protein Val02_64510 [Virgisporangium aliadipatigenens]
MLVVAGTILAFGVVAAKADAAGTDITDNGGTITAQRGAPSGSESYANLIDNDPRTKYFAGGDRGWVQYRSTEPAAVDRYTITSANDAPDRDPSAWRLEGSTNGTSWTTLDSRTGESFNGRGVTRGFLVANTVAYTYYRLTLTETNGSRDLQWAEWGLWAGDGQPAAPTGLVAAAVAAGTVDLDWRDNSDVDTGYPETGFEVQRSVDGGQFAQVAIVGADATAFTDTVATAGSLSYRVRAVTEAGPASEFSAVAVATPIDPTVELRLTDLPGSVTDRYGQTGDQGAERGVDRSPYTKYFVGGSTTTWLGYTLDRRATATRYTVTAANDAPERDPRNWSLVASADGVSWTTLDSRTDQSFTDRFQTHSYRLSNTAAYRYYRLDVTANNGSRDTQLGDLAIFGMATPEAMPLPAAPDALRVDAVSGDQLKISWADNTRWETAVRLERSTDGQTWNWSRTLPAGTTRYRDVGLAGNTTHHYRVRAENATGSSAYATPASATTGTADLPVTWQEHWHEHTQLVTRVSYNDTLGVYFDPDMEPSQTWLFGYTDAIWRYVRATYDGVGSARLAAVFHKGRYDGGHPATVFDAHHDYRNVIDIGLDNWAESEAQPRDIIAHEIAHIVEGSFGGIQGSPSFPIWMDSKWAEIFQYDVYLGAGLTADAQRWRAKMAGQRDGSPREGTAWFSDWFAPIYDTYGQSQVLVRYLRLLTQHFAQFNGEYARNLNWGEFVFFWSAAAGVDLRPLATNAFGWPDEWERQFQQARVDYPGVRFAACCGPVLVSDPGPQNAKVGERVQVQLRSSGGSAVRFTATGLPPGMTVSEDGLIGGTPTRSGVYGSTVTVTAVQDPTRTASVTIRWTVNDHIGTILAGNGECLDLDNSRTHNGNGVHTVGCNSTGAQKWFVSAGRYTVLDKCLATAPGAVPPGAAVVVWDCDGSANQQWTEPGDGTIRQVSSGMCLTRPTDTSWVSLTPCTGGDTQRWRRG